METRLAAVNALNHIAEAVPLWYPQPPLPEKRLTSPNVTMDTRLVGRQITALDIEAIVKSGNKLGTSAGTPRSEGEVTTISRRPTEGAADTAFLQNLGIDSTLVPKSESLSDVDVDDELMGDVKADPESGPRRLARTKRSAPTTSSVQDVKMQEHSRKRIKLGSAIYPSRTEGDSSVTSDSAIGPATKRPGRPKGSKSKPNSASYPSSPSGKATIAKDDDIFQGLSGRQVLVLKRKLKMNSITSEQAANEAKKLVSA